MTPYPKYAPSNDILKLKNVVGVTYDILLNGNQTLIELASGRKISIICNDISYGHELELFEMSVITSQNNIINKSSVKGWGDVVKGYMSSAGVEEEIPRLVSIYGRKVV